MIALKVLRADVTQDEMRLTRFRQEARAASALNHPNVCTIHSLGETADGHQFIAMEHIAGQTLRGQLKRTRLSPHDALDIIVQVASALTAAHAAGIVHRDLKPENVMVRPDGLIKVLDFGLAKLPPAPATTADATRSVAHTDVGMVVGTIAYMSPEQARGEQVDARTDIWSSGVMLYEMIAGRHPFAASSSSEVLAAILDREPGPLARFEPDVPPELQRIVTKALRKDREQRYRSCCWICRRCAARGRSSHPPLVHRARKQRSGSSRSAGTSLPSSPAPSSCLQGADGGCCPDNPRLPMSHPLWLCCHSRASARVIPTLRMA